MGQVVVYHMTDFKLDKTVDSVVFEKIIQERGRLKAVDYNCLFRNSNYKLASKHSPLSSVSVQVSRLKLPW